MILKRFSDTYKNSIGSIASNVIANEVEQLGGRYVFKYSLKRSEKVKTLPTKISVNLAVKVKLLLFLTCYFKG